MHAPPPPPNTANPNPHHSTAGHLLLHDFKTGTKLPSLPADGPVRTSLQFCPMDADLLAAAGDDGGVAVWSVRDRVLLHELRRLHRVRACVGKGRAFGDVVGGDELCLACHSKRS